MKHFHTLTRIAALAVAVCLLLCASAFASGEPSSETGSYESYAPETVVGTVNGDEVTWAEYYYWIAYYAEYVQQLASAYGISLTSWDACEFDAEMTNAQVVVDSAAYAVTQYHAYEDVLCALNVVPEEQLAAEIEETLAETADYYGDQDGEATEEEYSYLEAMLASSSLDLELFTYFTAVDQLTDDAFAALYGEDGSLFSDEDVQQYAADNGLMSAKHILLTTIDTSTYEPLSDDVCAVKLDEAESILALLQAVEDDPAALEAEFDDLMSALTEDTGITDYPDGYIFSEGEMVEAFETAVEGLDENYGLSDIVESEYGYHIILRTPVDPEAVVYDSTGTAYTLRSMAASEAYSTMLAEAADSADVQWNDGFDIDTVAAFLFG